MQLASNVAKELLVAPAKAPVPPLTATFVTFCNAGLFKLYTPDIPLAIPAPAPAARVPQAIAVPNPSCNGLSFNALVATF
jgi:hypothetical protein